jgi:hypothetical protein
MTITVEHPAGMWRPRWSRVHHAAERPGPRQPRRHRCHPWQLLAPRERSWRQRRRRGRRGWRAAGRRHEDVPLTPTDGGFFLHPERIGQEDAPPLREELQAPGELRLPVRPRLVRALRGATSPSYSSQRIAQPWMHQVCRLVILSDSADGGRDRRMAEPAVAGARPGWATVVGGQAGTVRVLGAWSGAMRPSGRALGAAW